MGPPKPVLQTRKANPWDYSLTRRCDPGERTVGQVKDTTVDVWTVVIDSDHNAFTVGLIGDTYAGSERKCFTCRS
jgi:hypothetical protein